MKKYISGTAMRNCFTDTDSLLYDVQTTDIHADMGQLIKLTFDLVVVVGPFPSYKYLSIE